MLKSGSIISACLLSLWILAEVPQSKSQIFAQGEGETETKEKKVYTNEDLIRLRKKRHINQGELETTNESTKASNADKSSRKKSESSSLSNYRDLDGHNRAYWQGKVRPLRTRLETLNAQITSLQGQQADTNVDKGIKISKKGRLQASNDSRRALSKRIADLEQRKTDVLKSIQELEEDARKAQALPEWLR
jgi:chromosome segregation ATPase